ncbi:VRR-NUC domain-containing protein [Corticibacterium sp. UT-5YL-CI-8]|nr:VRR-NUC domain-containing protein [Tianweitania sp. UT-5YL-CI-8]
MTKTTKTTTQTVRINGARVRLVTSTAGKVTAKAALPLEWQLQAAQVRSLRALPEYGKLFLLAGDQNAAKRGRKAQAEALAAGMTAGEPDLRIYGKGGRLLLIENKVGRATLTDSQRTRHPALSALGHPVVVLRAVSAEEASTQAVALVRSWLSSDSSAIAA